MTLFDALLGLALGVFVAAIYTVPMALEQRLTPRVAVTLLAWAGVMVMLVVIRDWLPGYAGPFLMACGVALVGQSLDYVAASTRDPEPEDPSRYRAHEPLAVTRPSLRSWGLFAIMLLALLAYYALSSRVVAP